MRRPWARLAIVGVAWAIAVQTADAQANDDMAHPGREGFVDVFLQVDGPEVRFLAPEGPFCEPPCAMRLRPGTYRLALQREGEDPVGPVRVRVEGTSVLRGEYVSRRGARIAGWVILTLHTIVGALSLGFAIRDHRRGSDVLFAPVHIGTSTVLLASGVGIGVPLITRRDRARIQAQPLVR
jgi:hypothetical protein